MILLLAGPLAPGEAADVLQQVPRDALGVAFVRNLAETDARLSKLLGHLGTPLPGPLAMLKSIGGVEAGLDLHRHLLVVILPPRVSTSQFPLAVWLPVKDYDLLVRSLEGDPQRRVAAITIAGEDLLVVRHDDWAVVMDADQRDRLEQLRETGGVPPPHLAEWSAWIETNDAVVVALPSGIRALWARAASERLFEADANPQKAEESNADIFAPARRRRGADDIWSALRHTIQAHVADSPELVRCAAETEAAACGVKLGEEGSAVIGMRLAFSNAALQLTNDSNQNNLLTSPPRLYESGDFVITGSGQASARWTVPAVAPYVRQVTNDLVMNYGNELDEADIATFRKSVEQAVAEVNSFGVLTRPGAATDGVFTNNFLALRVASSQAFLEHASEAMRHWNAMLDQPKAAIRLVFKSKPITVAKRVGTEYSIDMAAAVGAPALPELRTSMAKLFGPGGEFRLQFIAVDDTTVLLAAATEAQAAQAIEILGKAEVPSELAALHEPASLLADGFDWRLFVSPHGYNQWLKRQMDAVLGPVIGGPIVREFPESPPLGIAGGVDGRILWAELSMPAETIRGVGNYLHQ